MSQDLITRNLSDQSQNFGQELVVNNTSGSFKFVDANSGAIVSRAIDPAGYTLNNSPLDNSFQLDPNQYAQSTALFQGRDVPVNVSNTFGAIASVTAKANNVSPLDLFRNGVMSQSLLDNVNFFRTVHSQIGFNPGSQDRPYQHNLILGAKINNQTI